LAQAQLKSKVKPKAFPPTNTCEKNNRLIQM
jgi:hypothetical protein